MPLTPQLVEQSLNVWTEPNAFTYDDKDVMLYALGIGYGRDPLNEAELKFVYEKDLRVVPTAATVLAAANPAVPRAGPGGGMGLIEHLNFTMVLHGEQRLEIHKPLPVTGKMSLRSRTISVVDKGAGKGAVLYNETVWTEQDTGEKVCTLVGATFARGDGGFGGSTEGSLPVHEPPKRAPDKELAIQTRPDQALLYRLNGDRNPLHSDPDVAKAAGFPKPILHGLCSYGTTCRAVIEAYCDFDPARIRAHDVRFSAPVFPGETIVTRMWKDGDVVSFEAYLKERPEVTCIKNGRTVLAG